MKLRLVILTEIISPYRIPLFNALSRNPEIDLHVLFLSETDPSLRQWSIYKDEIKFSYEVLPSWRKRIGRFNALLNGGVNRALSAFAPSAIICGGYSYVASWQSLIWARTRHVPILLWSESNAQDLRSGYAFIEFLKDEYLARCSGYIVPGASAREYLQGRKVKSERIVAAPNAVDNQFFMMRAAEVRADARLMRTQLQLPQHYFLFVGRLVREKGVFELLSAYAALREHVRREIGLVFVGDGPCRSQLEVEAKRIPLGTVTFVGFTQRESLAAYYALADALVLPTHSDTWGLVVNEAMACSLPVVVSLVAGCASDLVREGWNGFLLSPRSVSSIVSALEKLAAYPDHGAMGRNSLKLIADYSPEKWSDAIARAVVTTMDREALF